MCKRVLSCASRLVLSLVIALAISQQAVSEEKQPRRPDDLSAIKEFDAAISIGGDPVRGMKLYATCVDCHGRDGMGQSDGTVPVLAGQYRIVLLRQMIDYRSHRRWDSKLEHADQLRKLSRPRDLADVATYLSSLAVLGPARTGDGRHLGVGTATYLERCSQCHGANGLGDPSRGIAVLAGQHQPYLYRQFFDVLEQRRPTLAVSHGRFMIDLIQSQTIGIADHLSRLPRAPSADQAAIEAAR